MELRQCLAVQQPSWQQCSRASPGEKKRLDPWDPNTYPSRAGRVEQGRAWQLWHSSLRPVPADPSSLGLHTADKLAVLLPSLAGVGSSIPVPSLSAPPHVPCSVQPQLDGQCQVPSSMPGAPWLVQGVEGPQAPDNLPCCWASQVRGAGSWTLHSPAKCGVRRSQPQAAMLQLLSSTLL